MSFYFFAGDKHASTCSQLLFSADRNLTTLTCSLYKSTNILPVNKKIDFRKWISRICCLLFPRWLALLSTAIVARSPEFSTHRASQVTVTENQPAFLDSFEKSLLFVKPWSDHTTYCDPMCRFNWQAVWAAIRSSGGFFTFSVTISSFGEPQMALAKSMTVRGS